LSVAAVLRSGRRTSVVEEVGPAQMKEREEV
jgi:hypothetical protein